MKAHCDGRDDKAFQNHLESGVNRPVRMKLYLFTDGFPWGPGEKPFVIPELEALTTRFDVTVVSLASDNVCEMKEYVTDLPHSVEVIRWERHSMVRMLFWVVKMPFTGAGKSEILDLTKDGFSFGRLKQSAALYAKAESLRLFCRDNGVFDCSEDSVYFGFWFSTQCLALALEKRKHTKMKVVCRIHGYDLYNERNLHGRQPWQRYMRDACDAVLFPCESACDYFSHSFGVELAERQYVVNRLGVSAARRTPPRSQGAPFCVVSCSHVIPLKRVYAIAEAISLLPMDCVEWFHFGDGSDMSKLKDILAGFGYDANLMGNVDNEAIRTFYEQHHVDVFVTATSSEGGAPVSIQEALACGIPIIGTNVGGISEQIDGNGILLAANPSVEELALAIAHICKISSAEWQAMSDRSFEIWSENYNAERNKAELLRILQDL